MRYNSRLGDTITSRRTRDGDCTVEHITIEVREPPEPVTLELEPKPDPLAAAWRHRRPK